MGKIKVSNGKENYEIDASLLPDAAKDGYLPTEKIIVVNSKNPSDKFEISPDQYTSALKDGYNFSDIVTTAREQRQQEPPKKDTFTFDNVVFPDSTFSSDTSLKLSGSGKAPKLYTGVQTKEQRLLDEGANAADRLNEELKNSDNAVRNIILKDFQDQQRNLASSSDPDAPRMLQENMAAHIASMFNKSKENDFKFDLMENPNKVRMVLNEVAKMQPEKSKQIQTDLYLHGAQNRLMEHGDDIAKNIDKIKKGEIEYDIQKGILKRPTGVIDSFVRGWGERSNEISVFQKYLDKKGDEGVNYLMDIFDKERQEYHPDKPIPVAKGTGGFISEFVGSQGIPIAKGAIPTALGSYFGAPQAGIALGAALNADEFGARGFMGSARQVYNELLNEGVDKHEAIRRAIDQGVIDGAKGAIQAGVAAYVGAKTAATPSVIKWTPGYRNIITNVLKESKEFGKNFAHNFLPAQGVIAGTEMGSNIIAMNKGLKRSLYTNVPENLMMGLFMEAGIGLSILGVRVGWKGAKNLKPKEQATIIQNIARQPEPEVDKALNNLVADENITPEQASAFKTVVDQQKQVEAQIPEHVTDGDTRLEIQNRMEEYNKNKTMLGKPEEGGIHESMHGPIKDRQKQIEWEVAVLSEPTNLQAKMVKDKVTEIDGKIEKIMEKETPTAEQKTEVVKLREEKKRVEKLQEYVEQRRADPIARAEKIIEEDVKDDYAEWTQNKDQVEKARNNPEAFLEEVAGQAQDDNLVRADGTEINQRARAEEMYGKDLVKVAVELFPKTKPPAVITPEQNIPKETITIKPTQDAISEQSPTEFHVRQTPDDSGAVGEGNEGLQTPARTQKESAPEIQKVTINTETTEPFVTKSGLQTVTREGGKLVIKNKDGGEVSAPTRRQAQREYADNFDFEHGERAPELPDGSYNPDEVHKHIIETSKNPRELVDVYVNEEPTSAPLSTVERFIADFGMGKVVEESFYRHGDRKNLTPRMRKTYFGDKTSKDLKARGTEIDEIAREMSDHYGVEIAPQDIVDFITRFPNGVESALKLVESENASAAAAKFQELTGLKLNRELAESIIEKQFAKLDTQTQKLADNEYDDFQQLEDEYWNNFDFEKGEYKGEANKTSSQVPPVETGKAETGGGDTGNVQGEAAVGQSGPRGIIKEENAIRREQAGLPEYQHEKASFEQWDREGQQLLQTKYKGNVDNLLTELEGRPAGDGRTPQENAILKTYAATLDADIERAPSPELMQRQQRLAKIISTGSTAAGQQLVSIKGFGEVDNLSNFLRKNAEAAGVEVLPQEKINELQARYEKEKNIEAQLKEAYEKGAQDERAKAAEENIKNAAKGITKRTRKSDTDFKQERKAIVESMREKLRKARGETSVVAIPYAKELIAIAPDVARMVKSLAEQGILKLEDVVDNIHEEVKDLIKDVTKKDIIDIIAGEYTQQRTRSDLAEDIVNIRKEANLLTKLHKILKGEEEKKKPRTIETTRRIESLTKQINEARKLKRLQDAEDASATPEDPLTQERLNERTNSELVAKYRKALIDKIVKRKEQINEGNFVPEKKPKSRLKLDERTQALEDEWIRMKSEDKARLEKMEYDKQSWINKRIDEVWQILGLRRLVQTGADFSIPFRQADPITMNPLKAKTTAKGFANMFHFAASKKAFDRFQARIERSELGRLFVENEGKFSNPHELKIDNREEEFSTSILSKLRNLVLTSKSKSVRVGGEIIDRLWFSERAAAGFLNTVRLEEFASQVKTLRRQGFTPENSPELYKEAAKWTMNLTGRGNMLKALEDSHAARMLANKTFFGARLMAAKINLLNPVYYVKMSKPQRIQAIKDMSGYVGGLFLTAMAAKAAGADIELDYDKPDFLQLRFGDNVYDITGGQASYVRTFLRIISAGIKNAKYFATGEGKKGALDYSKFAGNSLIKTMVTNKLAPNTAYAWHAFTGKDSEYDEKGKLKDFDPAEIFEIAPLYFDDTKKAYQTGGFLNAASMLFPNLFGIGTQTYPDDAGGKSGGGGATGRFPARETRKQEKRQTR